ncbi:MAG TPA: HNH endonuclease [Lachnospiraceae bacterium]|nr:HNH endonuclease [Lachnospiraceae bacterium]
MPLKIECDWCGKEIYRDPCRIKKHNFCSRTCMAAYSSKGKNPNGYAGFKDFTNIGKHMSEMNRKLNPTRMTPETRKKLRDSRLGSGEGRSYIKQYGKHEHRIVAEQILGRKLKPGEIVHHIDGNKRNNSRENIRVFASQSEHAKLHAKENRFWKGGGAE